MSSVTVGMVVFDMIDRAVSESSGVSEAVAVEGIIRAQKVPVQLPVAVEYWNGTVVASTFSIEKPKPETSFSVDHSPLVASVQFSESQSVLAISVTWSPPTESWSSLIMVTA